MGCFFIYFFLKLIYTIASRIHSVDHIYFIIQCYNFPGMGFGNAFALTPEPGTYYSMGGQVIPSPLYQYLQPYVVVTLIRI